MSIQEQELDAIANEMWLSADGRLLYVTAKKCADIARSHIAEAVAEAEQEFLARCAVFKSLCSNEDMKLAADTIAQALRTTIESRALSENYRDQVRVPGGCKP